MNTEHNKLVVAELIRHAWNAQDFSRLDEWLHPDYYDHSFPPGVPPTREGLVQWIRSLSQSFRHESIIESIAAEGDTVALRIRLDVVHTGTWRGIEAKGAASSVQGFRFYELREGRVVTQHALIDGEALQRALAAGPARCAVGTGARQDSTG